MFHLFRRHQKVLLTTIATVAIGSMAFSAIAPIFMDQNPQSASVKELNKNLDEVLLSLFNHSFDGFEDKLIFPEAIFSEMLIETGILEQTAFKMKESLDPVLLATYKKIIDHQPAQVLQGMNHYDLAAKISPKLVELISKMKLSVDSCFEDKLSLLVQFFKQKQKVPAFMLYQYTQAISKGQSQAALEDFEWFGLKHPEDFFGKEVVEASIKNLIIALKDNIKGQDGFKVIQKYQAKLSSFYGTSVHPNQYFVAINIDPKIGLEALKTYEALKHLKTSIAETLLLDTASHSAFYDFASKKLPVNVYSFKEDVAPKSLEEAAFCELYAKQKQTLAFDQYEIKLRTLDKSKAFAKVSKKQIYSEALKGYEELASLMPYALSKDLSSDKDKLEAIKNLSGSSKTLFEAHIQKAVLKNQPELFQKALNELTSTAKTIFLTKDSKSSPIEGFASVEQLKNELDMLPVNTPVIFDVGSDFMHEIELVSKRSNQGTLTFQQALESGVLKDKLKASLESTYKELVKKSSHKFLNADKKIKTLDEAYSDVLEVHAKDLKKKLAQTLDLNEETPSKFLIKGYPKLILAEFKSLDHNLEDFRIEKQAIELARHEVKDPSCMTLFENKKAVLSDVILNSSGQYVFYEKTGEAYQGEPVLNKEALELLASEKLKYVLLKKL